MPYICIKCLVCIVVLFATEVSWGASTKKDTDDNASKTIVLTAPWISASSDEGLVGGFSAGFSHYPEMLLYSSFYTSSKGHIGIGLRGEQAIGDWRLSGSVSLTRIIRLLYEPVSGVPDPYAEAVVNRFELNVAALKEITPNLEIGPKLIVDIARGESPIDSADISIDLSTVPRFQSGATTLLGLRGRYSTTNPLRPINGYVVESSFGVGRSKGDYLDAPKFDFANELRLTYASTLTERTRFYTRAAWSHQHSAPPPTRSFTSMLKNLRGMPDQRDYGRRSLSLRTNYYFMLLRDWALPFRIMHNVWSMIPLVDMNVEMVAFYDIAEIGDPDYGWRIPRRGYGTGFRFVIPPELVLYLDFATTPDGDVRFYIGTGELL